MEQARNVLPDRLDSDEDRHLFLRFGIDSRDRGRARRTKPAVPDRDDDGGLLGGLDLDLDVDARGEVEALERLDRLARGLDDVEEALVDAHLEVLARVLVDVR